MRITLKQLAVFKAVNESRQISKAAKRLHLSVPAVSMNLKELESALDQQLFSRHSTGLLPTEKASAMEPYVNEILSKVRQIEQMMSDDGALQQGSLRIGANKTAGNYILSRKLPAFQNHYPDCRFSLEIGDSISCNEQVSLRELDVAFVGHIPADAELCCLPWRSNRRCIVASQNQPHYGRHSDPARLSEATWILDKEGSQNYREAMELLRLNEIVAKRVITMSTMGAIKRAVGTGLGLSILPLPAVEEELVRGDLVELGQSVPQEEQNLYVVYRQDNSNPLLGKLLEFCRISLTKP
ncbi:LysR family transcriptional regulator [Ferrimonas marina]|uniref:DNA-binding transcriptional regulator, LysR family n=1 Tax=Ferrimonas marina TaxID=299255 RepID=A0A1M5VT14_9GAMM|nr:LysR family transcriptional regulator [Ferrimonas marina]SHH78405.1 DNA-binding transcriptional regulator, LysR family [Ferrimonas marina]